MEVLFDLLNVIYEIMNPWFSNLTAPIMKVLNGIGRIFSPILGDTYVPPVGKVKNGKLRKLLETVMMLILFGHFFVAWLLIKWSCVLTWRLFKKIFRIGR